MKVTMKHIEKLATDFAERYIKNWEGYIMCTSGYMAGYKQALKEAAELSKAIEQLGQNTVETEIKSHQIGAKITDANVVL